MKIEVYKETDDEWHPNYHKNLVSVSYGDYSKQEHYQYDSKYRVSVWGADDCGMELWFDATSEAKAMNLFMQVIGMKSVNRSNLTSLGMHSA
jgi:hypothetical protein